MSCSDEWADAIIATLDGAADIGKLIDELKKSPQNVSIWSVIKGSTAAVKIGRGWAKLHNCLEQNGKTAEAGAVREAMEQLQREADLLKSKAEAAGHTVPAP